MCPRITIWDLVRPLFRHKFQTIRVCRKRSFRSLYLRFIQSIFYDAGPSEKTGERFVNTFCKHIYFLGYFCLSTNATSFSLVWIVKIWEPSCKIGRKHEIPFTGLFLPIFYDFNDPGVLKWNGSIKFGPRRWFGRQGRSGALGGDRGLP